MRSLWTTGGNLLIATDGGLKHNIGTLALILVIGDDNIILDGYNA